MKTEQQEPQMSPMSAEDVKEFNKNSSKIIEREQFPESPFMMNKIEEKGWFIALGDKRLTDYHEDKETIIRLLEKPTWELLITIMIAVQEDREHYKKVEKTILEITKNSNENLNNFNKHQAQKHGINLE